MAAIFGIGITISTDRSFSKLAEYRRLKRSAGILKLTTIPYLTNLHENLAGNLERFNDICSIEQANAALDYYASLDAISETYTSEWVQLMHSPDIIESIDTDSQFSTIYRAVSEQSLMKKYLVNRAVGARSFINRPQLNPAEIEVQLNIQRAREWRDDLKRENAVFKEAVETLAGEIDDLLAKTGTIYVENDRYR